MRPGPIGHIGAPCRATSGHRVQLAAQARPYDTLVVLCCAHRHDSPPCPCRPVAAREELSSAANAAALRRVEVEEQKGSP
jgi:hypothetical protein